jgi:hypothetical protein
MFIKNCWYVAAWDYELSGDSLMARKIAGAPVLGPTRA